MPATNVIETISSLFAPKERLSAKEWSTLINARLASIRPHLDSISFSKLGDLACLQDCYLRLEGMHAIKEDNPETWFIPGEEIHQEDRMDTQGWFFGPYRTDWIREGYTEWPEDVDHRGLFNGKRYYWGVTRRRGALVLVKIAFTCEERSGIRGYERATMVYIEEVMPSFLEYAVRQSPKTVFLRLGEKITEWVQDRMRLYEHAKRVGQEVIDGNKLLASFGQI